MRVPLDVGCDFEVQYFLKSSCLLERTSVHRDWRQLLVWSVVIECNEFGFRSIECNQPFFRHCVLFLFQYENPILYECCTDSFVFGKSDIRGMNVTVPNLEVLEICKSVVEDLRRLAVTLSQRKYSE